MTDVQLVLPPQDDAFTDEVDTVKLGPSAQALHDHLASRVIGQDRAHRRVARGFAQYEAGLREPTEPIGVFLFSGPTGWGKTEEAKEIARFLIADGARAPMSLIQCGKFSESHRIAEILGAPPGYLGHDKPPKLSQLVINKPYFDLHMKAGFDELVQRFQEEEGEGAVSIEDIQEYLDNAGPQKSVVCFDEVEKAHPDIWNALLHIVEDGELEVGDGTTTSFQHSVIILTCNIAGKEQQELISGTGGGMGFIKRGQNRDIKDLSESEVEELDQLIYAKTVEKIEGIFAPELVGRLRDDIIVFRTLTRAQQRVILDNMLRKTQNRVNGARLRDVPILLQFTEAFKEFVLDNGTNRLYGMRPLKRAVNRYVRAALANGIANGDLKPGDEVLFTMNGTRPALRRRPRPIPVRTTLRIGST